MKEDKRNGLLYGKDAERRPLLSPKDQEEGRPKIRKPSKCRQRVVLTACILLQVIAIGMGTGFSVVYVEVIKAFDSPRSEAALIQSVYTSITVGGGIFGVGVLTKYGPGPCTMVGSVVACIGLVISGFAVNVPMIIAFAGVVAGCAMSLCFLSSFVTVNWIYHGDAGIALVILTFGWSCGDFVMPYVNDLLLSAYGWKGTFIILGGIALNSGVCGTIIYHSRDYFHTGNKDTSHRKRCDVTPLKDPVLLVILLCGLMLSGFGNVEIFFLPDIMVSRGFERSTGALFVSLVGLFKTVGRGVGTFLRKCVRAPTVYHWAYTGMVIAVGHALVINVNDFALLILAIIVYGVSFGTTLSQAPTIIYETVGVVRYPQSIAILNVMYGFGIFSGGFLGGLINDQTGSYDLMFYLAAGSSVFVSIAVIVLLCVLRLVGSPRFRPGKIRSADQYEQIQDDQEESIHIPKPDDGDISKG